MRDRGAIIVTSPVRPRVETVEEEEERGGGLRIQAYTYRASPARTVRIDSEFCGRAFFNASSSSSQRRIAAGPPGALTEPDCASARGDVAWKMKRSDREEEEESFLAHACLCARARARTRIVGPWTFHYPYRGLAGPDRRSPSSIPPFPPLCQVP